MVFHHHSVAGIGHHIQRYVKSERGRKFFSDIAAAAPDPGRHLPLRGLLLKAFTALICPPFRQVFLRCPTACLYNYTNVWQSRSHRRSAHAGRPEKLCVQSLQSSPEGMG